TPLNLLSLHSSKVPYEQELNNKACYNEHFYESEYSFTKSIDLIRNNWDDITGYIEKEEEMLISIYFDNDLEYITLTCKYFN
ncbi:hypothetical protein VWM66_10805, partial [Campylobacter jejuni]